MKTKMAPYIEVVLLYSLMYPTLLAWAISAERCDFQCNCNNDEMTCQNFMPFKLPDGIKKLSVVGKADETNVDEFWADSSWDRLECLTLQNYTTYSLHPDIYTFSNLLNLSYFGLHSSKFDQLENSHLKAMPRLKELDLSGSFRLRFPTIISALSGGNLPNLEELNLDFVATDLDYTSGKNRIDSSFVNVLLGKPLKKLIVTNTMIEVNATVLFQIPSLEFVNISGPWMPAGKMSFPTDICKSSCLQTLDLSVSMISLLKTKRNFKIRDLYAESCELDGFITFLMSIQNVYLDNILDMTVIYINVTYNMTDCLITKGVKNVYLKTIHLRQNGLKHIDINFADDIDIGLLFLDLSENILEYVSPDFFKIFGSILSLDLSSNYLYKMENSLQFKFLFKHLRKLNFINLSANQISVIPNDIFTHNIKLTNIDLSLNKISQVDFNIQQLQELRILNLAGNRIKFIEVDFLQQLNRLSIYPSSMSSGREMNTSVVFLNNNQFECSCNSVAFLHWLMSRYNWTETNRKPTCLLEGTSKTLDQDAVGKSEYLCIKAAVTISIYISSVLLVMSIVGTLLGFYVRRLRRIRKDKVQSLIQTLREQIVFKYLIFFSYCGEDEDLALNGIYPKLSETLHTLVDFDKDLICVGNLKFRLGFPVHEEIVKCISESCVVVLLVSNTFYESTWCEAEMQEAAAQNKPIVLFLVNDVDESLMSPYLHTLFHRYTRVVVTAKDDEIKFKPEINTVGQSLLELSADCQKYGGFYELFNRSVSKACCKIQRQ